MAIVYLLAHFDDEYGALPLIRQRAQAGLDQRLIYVADYASPSLARRRRRESEALIGHLGLSPDHLIHLGCGVLDGRVWSDLERAFEAVRAAVEPLAPQRITVTAWEGGHPDHDACALMAAALASRSPSPTPIDQFSLYHGRGLPGRLFRACDPIDENGPVTRVPISAADWVDYAASVRFFPSQLRTWAGLWPAMFATFAARGGFGFQDLAPGRVRERPHAGPLLYERMFGVAYDDVRRMGDALLDRI